MQIGKVVTVVRDKGFGFLKLDGLDEDVYFHRSALRGSIDAVVVGQIVEFESRVDEGRHRATVVIPVDRPTTGEGDGLACGFGFVTKLYRESGEGYLSPDKGGPELRFDASAIQGPTGFSRLSIGESVRFVAPNVQANPREPIAYSVTVVERTRQEERVSLPRHPRARRKKPSWRGK